MKIFSKENAPHYRWGEESDGWHLLNSSELSVIQERMPPGEEETFHHHQKAQQLFYILSGEATFRVENDKVIVKAGQSLHLPAQTPHQIKNDNNDDLNFLVISCPHAHGDRFLD